MKIAIVGAGGLGRVVADLIERGELYDLAGFVDDGAEVGATVRGLPVLGASDDLARLRSEGHIDAVAVAVGNNAARRALAEKARVANCALPALKDATAVVSPSARIGEGAIVAAGVIIGPDAEIGRLAIINTAALVEHDAVCEEACYVGPRCLVDARAVVTAGKILTGGGVLAQDGRL